MTGIELIAREREEQITKHGISVERDVVQNGAGQLWLGAVALLHNLAQYGPSTPPGFNRLLWLKILSKSRKEQLVIAGALIAAEIDRLTFLERESNSEL